MNAFLRKTVAVAFALVTALTFLACPAEAQSPNNEKRLLGTWVEVKYKEEAGDTMVFKPDGTVKIGNRITKYAVASNKLAIVDRSNTEVFDLVITSDGKMAILSGNRSPYLLRKKD